nr:hypothetical protein [Streptomyces sp. GZWMJZ-114]
MADWAEANNAEIAFIPTDSSWLKRIEAQFTALRYFALDGTDHRSHREQGSMIRRYIIWRNRHTETPGYANSSPVPTWPETESVTDEQQVAVRPAQRHLAQSPDFSDPLPAALCGEPIQLPDQRRDLPVVENRITMRIERAEQGKRRPVQVAKGGLPRQPAARPRQDLALQLPAHPHIDHHMMLLVRPRSKPGERCLLRH